MNVVKRIDHVAVYVRDAERSASWYEETLGLERRFTEELGPGAPILVGVGASCLALVESDRSGLAHVAFEVDAAALERTVQMLVATGVAFRRSDHGFTQSIYFPGPDGHEVEITTYVKTGGDMTLDPKAVITGLVETMFNRHDLSAADPLVAPGVVDHSGFPGQPPGLEGMKQRWGMLLAAFPDFQIEIHDLVAEGNLVSMRSTGRGTHQGDFFGVPATGKKVVFSEINLNRIEGGRMQEHWAERSTLEVMRQIGAL